jgi:cell cycle sensor histidine kinase DivJ
MATEEEFGCVVSESRLASDAASGEGEAAAPLEWGDDLARALVAHSADILLVLSAEHRCLFANPALRDVLGYQPESVRGADVVPLHHPDDLPRVADMLVAAAARPGHAARCETRIRHTDGSWRWMAVVATNRLADPAVRGIICNLRDITERREAAIATEAALHAQEIAARDLLQIAAAKSDFLRLLGHEFKTPLTAIAGFAELMELELPGNENVLESTRVIRDEARRLAALIDDLLLLDQMEATRLVLRRQLVDLNALAMETVERLSGLSADHEMRFALAPELPLIDADRERIAQAILNLVGNAIKYSPGGGAITILTHGGKESVVLSVADEGIGVPADELPSLFTRYRRARSGAARGIAGTGLGLAIVREIARLHGGEAWAESVEGEGSTFFLRLPILPAPADRPAGDELRSPSP